jgi:hypothetical protein
MPSEVADVVRDLAGSADVPVRLLIGSGAVEYAAAAARKLAESDRKWRPGN